MVFTSIHEVMIHNADHSYPEDHPENHFERNFAGGQLRKKIFSRTKYTNVVEDFGDFHEVYKNIFIDLNKLKSDSEENG